MAENKKDVVGAEEEGEENEEFELLFFINLLSSSCFILLYTLMPEPTCPVHVAVAMK